ERRGGGRGGGQGWGRRVFTRLTGGRAQGPAEPAQPQGVRAAERAGQQFYRRLLVQRLRAQGAPQQQQQRPRAGLGFQRQLITGDDRGHAGGGQRPAQQRHLADDRPDQDRHRRPGHPVVQMGAAERIGHHGGFLAGAGGDDDPDRPGGGRWQRPQVAMAARR